MKVTLKNLTWIKKINKWKLKSHAILNLTKEDIMPKVYNRAKLHLEEN